MPTNLPVYDNCSALQGGMNGGVLRLPAGQKITEAELKQAIKEELKDAIKEEM